MTAMGWIKAAVLRSLASTSSRSMRETNALLDGPLNMACADLRYVPPYLFCRTASNLVCIGAPVASGVGRGAPWRGAEALQLVMASGKYVLPGAAPPPAPQRGTIAMNTRMMVLAVGVLATLATGGKALAVNCKLNAPEKECCADIFCDGQRLRVNISERDCKRKEKDAKSWHDKHSGVCVKF